MAQNERSYIAIDLKSFYASVECVERGLDPLTTNLVVADSSRTEKTICLAVSPSLKAYGIGGRARLFEVVQRVEQVNAQRKHKAPNRTFTGKSSNAPELNSNPALAVDYITNWCYSNGRNRYKYVPCKDRYGYCGEENASRQGRSTNSTT